MRANRFLDAAISAAARGWHVFPLWPDSKRPAIRGWPTAATTDIDRIQYWWTANPRCNIAVATGPSGLHVLDLDVHHGHNGPDALYQLATTQAMRASLVTFTVATASNGRHLYFRAPEGMRLPNTVARLGAGIDSRGEGGYVVAAGSRASHGRYRILADCPVATLPDWLTDLLTPPPLPEASVGGEPLHSVGAYVAAIVAAETRKVAAALPGSRNATLFRAAFTLGRLVAGGELDETRIRDVLIAAAAIHVGHDFTVREVERAIANGLTLGANRPRRLARSR
ncbi:bifunctional DNA primase/polymerase [Nocardia uniformis]|uniref:bifunctional DNA primase/polymerase n=1 Tax=Nocardia uniformis TaxID=53432 RepID=UPI00082CEBBF|nr:bifunctional DNA primase/polymerase [Nocardia uniformis]